MKQDPTSYALVYVSKLKKDLATAHLANLPLYHERIYAPTDDLPTNAFEDLIPDT
jgi:hypothetical protein